MTFPFGSRTQVTSVSKRSNLYGRWQYLKTDLDLKWQFLSHAQFSKENFQYNASIAAHSFSAASD